MKKILLKILFSPLLLLWIIIVPLFKLLNKYHKAPVWNYKGVFLVDTNQDIDFKVEDESEGSEVTISIYWNNPVNKKYIHILAKNTDIDTEVYLNTEFSNIKIEKK